MDIKANLNQLLDRIESDRELRAAVIHNLHAFFSIHVSINLATKHPLNFDIRRDLWHRPDRILLVGYYAEYFRDVFAPIKQIRSHLFATKTALEGTWQGGLKDKHFPRGLLWEQFKKGEWARFCEAFIAEVRKSKFPDIETQVLSRHPAFKGLESSKDRLIGWLEECAQSDNPQNCNKGFRLRMAMIPYFLARSEGELPLATLSVLAWDAVFTMTNAYKTGGQQVMAPVLGNDDCGRLLGIVNQWISGKTLTDAPFTGLTSRGDERTDCSDWSTVTELYGFLKLHEVPYINGVNAETFQAIAGRSDPDFADAAGKRIRATLTQHRELATKLHGIFAKLKNEIPPPSCRLEAMESNKARRLADLYVPTDQLKVYVESQYAAAYKDFTLPLQAIDESMILAHILFDSHAYREKVSSLPSMDSPVEEDDTAPKENSARLAQSSVPTPKQSTLPLNTILCGPPGTGKTYQSVYRALEIIDGHSFQTEATESRRRALAMERFQNLRQQGRIAMVTFHQSYSYEDFVEGIRPVVDSDDQNLRYKVQPGAMRDLVGIMNSRAASIRHRAIRDNADVWRISLGDDAHFRNCIATGCIGIDYDINEDLSGKDLAAHFSRNNLTSGFSIIRMFRDEVAQGDIVCVFNNASSIKAIGVVVSDYFFDPKVTGYTQRRRVQWLDQRVHDILALNGGKRMMTPALHRLGIRPDSIVDLVTETAIVSVENRPYVLIIDEINRGNLSKIFGELITLIESDKREGAPNGLSVRLPYSGYDFSLPPNLHIIGTMNTADRSIAMMDFALRRRFVFQYLAPNPNEIEEYVEGIPLRAIFRTLNQRIEERLGRDYMIGHALLMGVKNLESLKQVWCEQIVPLLGEYFFDEWRHLEAVIPGFVENVGGNVEELSGRQAMRIVTTADDSFADRLKKCA